MRPLEEIIGQARATSSLARALAEGRLFPSLIFHGPAGVGKLATAVALSRILLCTAPSDRPCRRCSACRRVDERALLHPSLQVVFPERLKDFEREEDRHPEGAAGIDLQERQAEAAAHPAWSVLIGRIRRAIALLQRHPGEGGRSILIVDQAHRMPAEPANALLKTLEEPPPHAVVILSTLSYHALLPTIRSRCQAVPFQLVPRSLIASCLVSRRAATPGEADLRAGLSGGRIGVALDLDLEEHRRRREAILKGLEAVLERGDPGIAVARAEAIVRRGDDLEADLGLLMTLVRDLMILGAAGGGSADRPRPRTGGEPAPDPEARLIHRDLAARLGRLAARAPGLGPGAVRDLDAILEAIRRRGNRQLLLENFLLSLLPREPDAAAPGVD
ncbi:MAG: ATP-binding protein [Acidobacteriota bacterium]